MKQLILIVCLVLSFPLMAKKSSQVYVAPSPEPTDEETLNLQLINRFRLNPHGEYELIVKDKHQLGGVDTEMFKKEMMALKAVAPVVFNLNLLKAARRHSYYMIINNKMTHDETPGNPGFVAAKFSARCKKAGYKGRAHGENAYLHPRSVLSSHYGYIVDRGAGGSGGMQKGRGHRMNIMGKHNEVGCGGIRHGEGDRFWSSIHNFGSSNGKFVGGVMYMDYNGNNFYDIGEGLEGVEISSNSKDHCKSWKSGAYTLKLLSGSAKVITASFGGVSVTHKIKSDSDVIQINIDFKKIIDKKVADMVAAAEKIEDKKSNKYFNLQLEIHTITVRLKIEDEQRDKLDAITGEAGKNLATSQKLVLDTLNAVKTVKEFSAFKKVLRAQKATYSKTTQVSWYKEIEKISKLTRKVNYFEKDSLKKNKSSKTFIKKSASLILSLEKLKGAIKRKGLQEFVQAYIIRIIDCSKK